MTTWIEKVLKAVSDDNWQTFRISLKGLPTETKLELLEQYRKEATTLEEMALREIRVTNYINALKRGGQIK